MKCDELQYERLGDANKTYPASTLVIRKQFVDAAIAELKAENERLTKCCKEYDARQRIDERIKFNGAQQLRATKRALWVARASAAKSWAEFWFDVAPLEHIKYDRIGRMEGVEKEFILTKVTKHMTASDWVGLWEKVERKCREKAKEYKPNSTAQ